MLNRTTSTNLPCQHACEKIRNPNIERGPADRNKRKQLNPNDEIRNGPVWNIEDLVLVIGICFEFRVFSLRLIPWRPLRLCASHRISDLIFMNQKFQISLLRYLILEIA